jgi:hypothetical protein
MIKKGVPLLSMVSVVAVAITTCMSELGHLTLISKTKGFKSEPDMPIGLSPYWEYFLKQSTCCTVDDTVAA